MPVTGLDQVASERDRGDQSMTAEACRQIAFNINKWKSVIAEGMEDHSYQKQTFKLQLHKRNRICVNVYL